MCIACSPGFQTAFRSLSWPSRRGVLKGAAAVSASGPFIAEAVMSPSARADGRHKREPGERAAWGATHERNRADHDIYGEKGDHDGARRTGRNRGCCLGQAHRRRRLARRRQGGHRRSSIRAGKKVMFFPGQIKLFADGAIISQLMQMKGGYLDGHQGEWIIPPDELERRARLFWNAGYQIHTHVNGDLGLEKLLDILEKLNAEHPRADHRCVIVHFANSNEDQVARIKRLGVIVSANPYYPVGFADKYSEVGLGPQRADLMVRAKSVLDQDISLSYHSDLPMAPAAPLYLAWCGVNRITPSGRVAGPDQRISIDAALRAITIDAAYSWRKEDLIGSIAPGKIANLTVLEEDPYAVPPEKLNDISIWGTVFEGRVFQVPEDAKRLQP